MKSLTKKQKEILDYINQYIEKYNISPTIEEIRKKFKLKAVSTIHEHLNELKIKGYIKKDTNQSRSIHTSSNNSNINVPLVGSISAGYPIDVYEEIQEFVSIAKDKVNTKDDLYALKVIGNSMIEDGIFDGDIVVIKKQTVAENGQTVVAIVDDEKTTLKKIYKEKNGKFRLQPMNSSMLPLFYNDVEIRGVLLQVIRNIDNTPYVDNKNKKNKYKTLDLFAGVGGIRLGFERAGFETVFANDFEANCKHTYDLNFPTAKLVVEDMRKLGIDDLPKFDFLLGGFPCQAFSIAGYRQGFNDEKNRGNLFFDIVKILEARKPMGFLLENVKNLASHDGGKTFMIIQEALADLGYHIKFKVLNSMEYGNVPQNRERIYIVGFRDKKLCDKFNFPEKVKLTTKITDILEDKVDEKYYYNGKPLYEKLKKDVKEYGKVYQWRRQYVRENKKGVSPTLTANMGTGGHNVPIIKDKKGIRKLTPKECSLIQGFPKDFKLPKIADSALYKQFGNSVSVPVLEAIAKGIMKVINSRD